MRFDADVRPPGERYFRHPGDLLRLVLWGAVTARARDLHLGDDVVEQGPHRRPRPRGRRVCRTRCASWCWPSRRSRPIAVPLARADRAGRAAALAAARDPRARRRRRRWRCSRCSTSCSISTRASPARSRAARGSRRPASRRSRTSAGAAAATTVGKPWLLALVAARRATSGCWCSSCAMALAGSAGVPELILALRRGRHAWVPACSSRSDRRTAGPRRPPWHSRWARPGSTSGRCSLDRAEGGRAQLYRADDRRRRQLREGVRAGQPRRRPPVPRVPRAAAPRPERRLPVVCRSSTTSSTRR